MKKFYFSSLIIVMINCLFGCANGITSHSKSQFEVAFGVNYLPEYEQYDNRVRFALKPLKGYGQDGKNSDMRWSDSYYFNANNLPKSITINYAILLDKPTPVNTNIWEITNKKLQSLPPSAWRTHTIYPKQLLEQGRAMPANGEPAKNWAHGTKVTVTLYIDGHGNISQEIKHEPIRKDKWTT